MANEKPVTFKDRGHVREVGRVVSVRPGYDHVYVRLEIYDPRLKEILLKNPAAIDTKLEL